MHDVAENLARIRERIDGVRAGAGRTDEVTLVAVTKTVPINRIREALEAGQRVFGENRVQEGAPKAEALFDAEWHLIGHLQTNKARQAAAAFAMIESVDSLRLASKLDSSVETGRRLPVLLEVNVADEETKSGFSAEGFTQAMPDLLGLRNLELRGLMTVAPLVDDPEEVRWVFRSLRELRDEIRDRFDLERFDQLSMGMSGDYEVAVQEGATMVRLGRAIFGDRPAQGKG